MAGFGEILKKWETNGARRVDARQARPEPPMDPAWLERYPPSDKDAELTAESSSRPIPAERLPADAEIDLHGYRLEEALAATSAFVADALAKGYRKIVVIHGKGENGQGILRKEIRTLLERHPRTGRMGYEKGSRGGRGALWVVLRGSDYRSR